MRSKGVVSAKGHVRVGNEEAEDDDKRRPVPGAEACGVVVFDPAPQAGRAKLACVLRAKTPP